jgi:PhnB protein
MPLTIGNNINFTIGLKDMDEIKSIFSQLKEGGTVNMELQETFWSKLYGSVADKFGIPLPSPLQSTPLRNLSLRGVLFL